MARKVRCWVHFVPIRLQIFPNLSLKSTPSSTLRRGFGRRQVHRYLGNEIIALFTDSMMTDLMPNADFHIVGHFRHNTQHGQKYTLLLTVLLAALLSALLPSLLCLLCVGFPTYKYTFEYLQLLPIIIYPAF